MALSRAAIATFISLLVLGLIYYSAAQPTGGVFFISPTPRASDIYATLFFSSPQGDELMPETRLLQVKGQNSAEVVLEELIRGPNLATARRTLPPETKVIAVQVVDGVAHVNFSRNLVAKQFGGSAGEKMAIMSIVYTLTELPGIEKVQLLVEGAIHRAVFGNIVTLQPIGRQSGGR